MGKAPKRKSRFRNRRFLRNYLDNLLKKTGDLITLLATPAEGLSGRFVRMDKKVLELLKVLLTVNTIPTAFTSPYIIQ